MSTLPSVRIYAGLLNQVENRASLEQREDFSTLVEEYGFDGALDVLDDIALDDDIVEDLKSTKGQLEDATKIRNAYEDARIMTKIGADKLQIYRAFYESLGPDITDSLVEMSEHEIDPIKLRQLTEQYTQYKKGL